MKAQMASETEMFQNEPVSQSSSASVLRNPRDQEIPAPSTNICSSSAPSTMFENDVTEYLQHESVWQTFLSVAGRYCGSFGDPALAERKKNDECRRKRLGYLRREEPFDPASPAAEKLVDNADTLADDSDACLRRNARLLEILDDSSLTQAQRVEILTKEFPVSSRVDSLAFPYRKSSSNFSAESSPHSCNTSSSASDSSCRSATPFDKRSHTPSDKSASSAKSSASSSTKSTGFPFPYHRRSAPRTSLTSSSGSSLSTKSTGRSSYRGRSTPRRSSLTNSHSLPYLRTGQPTVKLDTLENDLVQKGIPIISPNVTVKIKHASRCEETGFVSVPAVASPVIPDDSGAFLDGSMGLTPEQHAQFQKWLDEVTISGNDEVNMS